MTKPQIGPIRSWIISVRFWPVLFIVVSCAYTAWVTLYVMTHPEVNTVVSGLPATAHLFTGTLVMKFIETKGTPPPAD